ncbi:MAG: hypothetical protein BWK80_16165 [Desulfobacteraceae bacterium IS3]|nr:MAG: hypothetical protein BWK80_16165 [Desulfobacteraceae bacterium IS3]
MLYKAQTAGKRVYVFSAHSHYYQENIFDTAHYQGKVLPGWTIGTAGAQQYIYPSFWSYIRYGYALVEIRGDGTMNLQFVPVTRNMAPFASGKGAEELTQYCFEQNHRPGKKDSKLKSCVCNEAK